ncbi:hypothetical protein [Saccharothrix sp. Mg75]|uniref:hypothetical protein n=1 Tax=Saccharothrix sp. Mg75 TaxID=3445357 RepID=UPI003EE85B9C
MRNLIGRVAAVLVAAAAVTTTGGIAQGQGGTVTIEGLVWFDRDANGRFDEGEQPLSNGRAVRVFEHDTKAFIGEYGTDANGRYRVEGLPDVKLAIYNPNTDRYEATTDAQFFGSGSRTLDFGIRGGTVEVSTFIDADQDGTRQTWEREVEGGEPIRLIFDRVDRPAPVRGADNVLVFHDLPFGEHLLLAPEQRPFFELAPVLTERDVDPATYRKAFHVDPGTTTRVDVRYVRPDSDWSVGAARLEPAKDVYQVGDEVEFVVSVTSGAVQDQTSVFMFKDPGELLSLSDNLVDAGAGEFVMAAPVEPNTTSEFRLRYRVTDLEVEQLHLFVDLISRRSLPDPDSKDNHAFLPIEVVERTTTTPPAEPTTTAPANPTDPVAPTTTTTAAAVAQTGPGGGLAGTGAAPFALLVAGALLVGGGSLALLAARRRRRA